MERYDNENDGVSPVWGGGERGILPIGIKGKRWLGFGNMRDGRVIAIIESTDRLVHDRYMTVGTSLLLTLFPRLNN